MWYVAQILLAQKPTKNRSRVLCETCHVLLQAATARKAYRKAQTWATKRALTTGFCVVGVQHITDLSDKQIGDGTEVGGHFFYKVDPWSRRDKLIPHPDDIPIMRLEANAQSTVGELATKKQLRMIKDMFPEGRTR